MKLLPQVLIGGKILFQRRPDVYSSLKSIIWNGVQARSRVVVTGAVMQKPDN